MLGIKALKSSRTAGTFIAVITATLLLSIVSADIYAQRPRKKVGVFFNKYDKKKTVGYTQIGLVWGQLFSPPRDLPRILTNLKEAMNKYTKIETENVEHLELASAQIMKVPIIFILSNDNVELTPTELENLKKYIEIGGFIVVDSHRQQADRTGAKSGDSLKKMLKDIIPNARFEPLSNSHALYHSFFDFNDGPPLGADNQVAKILHQNRSDPNKATGSINSKRIHFIEGVYYKGRLVAVCSEKGYGVYWAKRSEPQLRLGVNMIVFALTQEGGIAEVH